MRGHALLLAAALVLGASAAAADQRGCLFERQIYEGVSRTVALPVGLNWSGQRGVVTVQVAGGGRYDSATRLAATGGMEMSFRTPVSSETLTIDRNGNALWAIAFDDGRVMSYAGRCGQVAAG